MALSGGADSVALLHYLKARELSCGFRLSAVHCEHGIRGEDSVADKEFVRALCKKWDIPLFIFEEDCPKRAKQNKESLETAARNFRRESFFSLVDGGKIDYIATAHHIGDEAETVLLHIARGAALSGARGIEAETGFFIRPFLSWTKEKILAYIEEHGLSYRVDETNFLTDATRNKLRLQVLPSLEEAVPAARENIARFARKAAEDDAFLYALSEKLLCKENDVFLLSFSEERPLFYRACLTALKGLGLEKDYTAKHLDGVYGLQASERGSEIHLPKGIRAVKTERGISLSIEKGEKLLPPVSVEKPFSLDGFDGGRYAVSVSTSAPDRAESEWRVLRIDGDELPKDAVFRFRKEGDEIEKFGGGRKSLKKFFNERKLPVGERAHLPLVASASTGEVYAVCGVEIAEGLRVTESTSSVLYITLRKN